jgi:hypothetical protein
VKPGNAIHPVVSSLFSAPKPGISPETFAEEIVTSDVGREFHEPTRRQMPPALSEIDRRAGVRSSDREQSPRLIATERVPGDNAPWVPKPAHVEIPQRRASSWQPDDEGDSQVESSPNVFEAATSSARDPFTPPIMEAVVPRSQTPSPEKVREPVARSSQSFATHSRATDDIEIHIGRIEVTAVQPAPTRTTPVKSPRRAPSLDDYLRRRDGSV